MEFDPAFIGCGGKEAGVVEPGEGQLAGLLDAGSIGGAFFFGAREQGQECDAQGGGAGESADAVLDGTGGDGGDGADFVEGFAEVGQMGVFGGAVGVAAEGEDVGVFVVGHPHASRGDGMVVEGFDAFAEVHFEGLEGDAVGAVAEPGVEFILQGDEGFDFACAWVFEGDGDVLDVDQRDASKGVVAAGDQAIVLVALPAGGSDQFESDRVRIGGLRAETVEEGPFFLPCGQGVNLGIGQEIAGIG